MAALLVTPVTARADMFKPSIQDQIKLGQRAANDLREQETILPDSDPRVKELRKLGNMLVSDIPEEERKKKPFQYTFDIIDSKDINAFALPGGPVFFYTGLLNYLNTEDELVGVLAHELTHVRNEHWASAYADNQKRQLGISLALILLRANRTVFDVASVSDTLLFTLPYSRKHETEADTVGYDLMVKAGYNPQGMVDVFTLLKEKGGGSGSDEWLSTHPDSDRRIKNIEGRISASHQRFPPETPLPSSVLMRNLVSSLRPLPVVH
ncbi:MAG TPA: M48 family metallopeptidase [Fimbriimonadaceae bacterium]|nr:M48 family metallopeptidase [Fimbriimonadaceae bacterium]